MSLCVAVSGGTDSLYALASLREAGERCTALHAVFLPEHARPADHAAMLGRLRETCRFLDIPLHVADCVEPFREKVIEPFVRGYARGETPNPCALCNASIKFGLLLDAARELGADTLATGHYAHLEVQGGRAALYAGADSGKDQSYFLSLVPEPRLRNALFPLGGLRKTAVRDWLAERGITPPAPRESQEICFVPDDAYREFVPCEAAAMGVSLGGPGPVLLRDGRQIGVHKGLWRYTEGQRKGLGIAWRYPLYVLEKNLPANTLIVGAKDEMNETEFACRDMNFLLPMAEWPQETLVRTRYRQAASPVTVAAREGTFFFTQDPSGGPYTAGQLATVYAREPGRDALRVLGGGVIRPLGPLGPVSPAG